MKMRLVNRRMEIMLEIGEACVKPRAAIDGDGWKVSLDYRIGQYGRIFPNSFDRFSQKSFKKSELLIKLTFRGPIEVLKVDSRTVFHADLGY